MVPCAKCSMLLADIRQDWYVKEPIYLELRSTCLEPTIISYPQHSSVQGKMLIWESTLSEDKWPQGHVIKGPEYISLLG